MKAIVTFSGLFILLFFVPFYGLIPYQHNPAVHADLPFISYSVCPLLVS